MWFILIPFFFFCWVLLHCVNIPNLFSPFTCGQTFISILEAIIKRLLFIFSLKSFCGYMFSFLLGKYLEYNCWGIWWVYVYKQLPFCTPTSHIWKLRLLHIFTNSWYCPSSTYYPFWWAWNSILLCFCKTIIVMYLFLAPLGLQCFVQTCFVMEGGGYSSLQHAVLVVWFCLLLSTGCRWAGWSTCSWTPPWTWQSCPWAQRMGSGAVVHRLGCSAACGTLPGQGSNSCVPCIGRRILNLLHHGGSPHCGFNLHFPHG